MIFSKDSLGHRIERTALLFVDPYNDFLAPKGKLWPMVAEVASAVGTLDNLRAATAAARAAGMQIIRLPSKELPQ